MNVKLKLMVSPAPEKFTTFIKFINFIIFRSLLHDRGSGPLGTSDIRCLPASSRHRYDHYGRSRWRTCHVGR
jgi:hypothetical protein